jgi:hypothetical protein
MVIPYTVEELEPETRALGERLGARFVHMPTLTSYFDLVEQLWAGEEDFINWEHDVLPTEGLVNEMWACDRPWCSGSFGRWWWEQRCARTEGEKPCGEPPGRCGQSDMSQEKAARIAACPLRLAGGTVLRSDSWLGLVKFGSIRGQVPDLLRRAEARPWIQSDRYPARYFDNLCRGIDRVLADEEGLSPHLHFPHLVHLKEIPGLPGQLVPAGPTYDAPWDQEHYERDIAENDYLRPSG